MSSSNSTSPPRGAWDSHVHVVDEVSSSIQTTRTRTIDLVLGSIPLRTRSRIPAEKSISGGPAGV